MHPGDSLARDEAGERFDGGAAASWASRSHRMFTAHSVAVAATHPVYRVACRETRRTNGAAPRGCGVSQFAGCPRCTTGAKEFYWRRLELGHEGKRGYSNAAFLGGPGGARVDAGVPER